MSTLDAVQAMSIQQLDFNRLASYISTSSEQVKKSKLTDLIKKVVAAYNTTKEDREKYQPIEFNLKSAFRLKVFAKIKKGKTSLVRRLQEQGEAQELPANAGSDFVLFFYRAEPVREVFALTTGTAWHVVRPAVSYTFPLESVIKTLDPSKITEVVRRCLVGPDTQETLTNPAGHLFYKTETLYHLVESFTCQAKKDSSLMELRLFKHEPSIKVETGVVRILSKVSLEAYPKILHLLSEHVRGEKTYSKDGKEETADPLFEFLRFLQPAHVKKEILDRQLLSKIFLSHQNKQPQTVQVRHKYFNDFVYAESYEIQLERGKNYLRLEGCPTLEDILTLISKANEEALKSEESFCQAIESCSLRYNGKNKDPLSSYLEGEILGTNGNTYFKVRNMWYKISADHYGLLEHDFRSLLRDYLAEPGKHPLTHPWIGNSRQGRLTETVVKNALQITKGLRDFMSSLKKARVAYVTDRNVNYAQLSVEILKNPKVKKHQKSIEEKLLSGSAIPNEETLKKLLGSDYEEVLKELEKSRQILDEKGFVINPFAYPLKSSFPSSYERLEALLKRSYAASQLVQSEEDYNRSYMYTATNHRTPFGAEQGILVIDQVCPEGIEAGDVIFYDRTTTLVAHLKEKLGQTTRDVCSQILNAAHKISSGLRLHQAQSYLNLLWDMVTEVKDPSEFRGQMREQFLHLGKEAFLRIFNDRQITFVYGLLKNDRQSLQKEKEKRTCLSAEDLKPSGLDHLKVFRAIQEQQFLDAKGRLTGRFYASSKEKFKVIGFEKDSGTIYALLSQYTSVSDSTIAKFELLRTAEELRKLGFGFKIVEIEKTNLEDPDSQSQASLASQALSASSQAPSTPSQPSPSFEIPGIDTPATDPSQKKLDKIENGPVGFFNIGNSCYINATLQVLFNIPELRELIETNKTKNDLLKELHALMQVTSGAEETKPILIRLRSALFQLKGKGTLPGSETNQQDAHEFLVFILEQLKWEPFNLKTIFKLDKTCKQKIVGSNHLQIPVQSVKTLQDAVDNYFKQEKIQADGDKITPLKTKIDSKEQSFESWHQKTAMDKTPDHLILHLMRFDDKGRKIDKPLEFPENGVVVIRHKKTSIEYEIVGLINHIGDSAESAHYTADLKNYRDPQGKALYVHCDDEELSLKKPSKSEMEAYLIVLKKKN